MSNKCIAVREVATPLRELICHMGSHSVICHPAEATYQPLPPAEAGTRFSDPGGQGVTLRPRGPCGLEAKSFGLDLSLGLTLSGLGLDLGLMASGLGLIEIGLVALNIYSAHDINFHNIAIDNHFCCVFVAY